MLFLTCSILAGLAASAVASKCTNLTIPLSLSARQAVFDVDVPQTNLEVTDFILNLTQQGRTFSDVALKGYNTTVGTYNISASFCTPDNDNSTDPAVQVLTHGIGFDKGYWNLPFNGFNYSYVDYVTSRSYSTLSFDRLGIGNSSHGDPLTEIQSFLEVAATAELTKMLRNGTFPGVSHSFTKIVHVGHSFGSAQTYSLANMYPELTDGIILTGFSMNSTFATLFQSGGNFVLASQNQPLRFGDITGSQIQGFISAYAEPLAEYLAPVDLSTLPAPQNLPNGYLISSNIEANKYLFLKTKYYDPAILQFAEQTKQPVTVGELLTLGSLSMTNNYTGPVLVITGDSDLPYCGSDCLATGGAAASIPAQVAKNFPNVAPSNFSAYIQPNTGHGINFHYNATGAYGVITDFLSEKGLTST